jgi:hypothetical protein
LKLKKKLFFWFRNTIKEEVGERRVREEGYALDFELRQLDPSFKLGPRN